MFVLDYPYVRQLKYLCRIRTGIVEPKVKFSKNTPKGFYHLYVNDKNELDKLVAQIDQTSEGIKMVIGLVNSNLCMAIRETQVGVSKWLQISKFSSFCSTRS